MILTISREQERFYAQVTGQPKVELFAETATQFFITEVDAQITFFPDQESCVSYLLLYQAGQEITARKLTQN